MRRGWVRIEKGAEVRKEKFAGMGRGQLGIGVAIVDGRWDEGQRSRMNCSASLELGLKDEVARLSELQCYPNLELQSAVWMGWRSTCNLGVF